MRFTQALLLSFFSISCNTYKHTTADDLKKYSYQLIAYSEPINEYIPAGTCFFIRDNGNLFLITAKHVFDGCDEITGGKAKGNYPDTLHVVLENSQQAMSRLIPIVIKKIKDTIPCFTNPLDDVDIISVPIDDEKELNSIERYLVPRFKHVSNIEIYGFPSGDGSQRFTYKQVSNFNLNVNEYRIIPIANPKTNKMDTLNFTVGTNKLVYDSLKYKGYSGSPVFIQDSITHRWRIMGLWQGSNQTSGEMPNCLIIPRIEFVLSQIRSRGH